MPQVGRSNSARGGTNIARFDHRRIGLMAGWRAEEIARRKVARPVVPKPQRTSYGYRPYDADALVAYINERAAYAIQDWQYRFLDGWLADEVTIGGLSCARGGGKTALVEGIAAACIDPNGPLHQGTLHPKYLSVRQVLSKVVACWKVSQRCWGYLWCRGVRGTGKRLLTVQRSEGSLLIEHALRFEQCGCSWQRQPYRAWS